MQTEPAQIIGWITGAAAAIVTLLVAFGVDLTEDQRTAILGVVAILAPVIAGIVIRSKVYSPRSTQAIAVKSAATGVPEVPPPPAQV